MLILIFSFCFVFFISLVLMSFMFLFSEKSKKDREKSAPFECGFDPFSSGRLPFSLRFFLIAIIFLIFDVEIVLILPFPIGIELDEIVSTYFVGQVFLLILLLGLFHEWNEGALDWAI